MALRILLLVSMISVLFARASLGGEADVVVRSQPPATRSASRANPMCATAVRAVRTAPRLPGATAFDCFKQQTTARAVLLAMRQRLEETAFVINTDSGQMK